MLPDNLLSLHQGATISTQLRQQRPLLQLHDLQATQAIAFKTQIHALFQVTAIMLGVNVESATFILLITLDADLLVAIVHLLNKTVINVVLFSNKINTNNLMSLKRKNKHVNKTNNNLRLHAKAMLLNLFAMTIPKQLFSLTCPVKKKLDMKQMTLLQTKMPLQSLPLLRILHKKHHRQTKKHLSVN